MTTGLPKKLLRAEAYPHAVDAVELIETHLSWVFLTGLYAYKVKKPVCFDFVDFSTLQRRKHFCEEELRCNKTFSPELYIGVVAIVDAGNDRLMIASPDSNNDAEVVDFAVQMRQFEQAAQADNRLHAEQLTRDELSQFGHTLAVQHAGLARIEAPVDVVTPMLDNFATLRKLASAASLREELEALERAARDDIDAAHSTLIRRHNEGFTRECHGDLHLQNLVLTEHGLRAFDCLEFDLSLRTTDVCCDAAFLFMDCGVRGRDDLGYAFIDGYLDVSGDYDGVTLLPLYARYRAMVRAKVSALQLQQAFEQRKADNLQRYTAWAAAQQRRPAGRLIVSCGVSGSGKSHWAAQLVAELPALRLRSDVLRKHLHGIASADASQSSLQTGLYTAAQTQIVYAKLAELTAQLLERGENVIVDCTNLELWQRQLFYAAANMAGSHCVVLHFTAPQPLLKQRIEQRRNEGVDASEADLQILQWQLARQQPPTAAEPVVRIDTEQTNLGQIIELLEGFNLRSERTSC